MFGGIRECARVTGRLLLVKCMIQVASGRKWFQPRLCAEFAERECGLVQIDEFHMLTGGREQPAGRRQLHSRGNFSTLVVLARRGGAR